MSDLAYPCAICGAMGRGAPPHGWGEPCPQKLRMDDAYIALCDAQRMAAIRSGSGMSMMGEAFGKLAGGDDE